jgi:hypothetical protein
MFCFVFLGVYMLYYIDRHIFGLQFMCNEESIWFLVPLTFQSISAYSGHYRPTDETLETFLSYLRENGVNLDEVEVIDYLQIMYIFIVIYICISMWLA